MSCITKLLDRLKTRHYIALTIIAISVLATPAAIEEAYRFRGYEAFGGEYMLIPAGIVIAVFVCMGMAGYDADRMGRKG